MLLLMLMLIVVGDHCHHDDKDTTHQLTVTLASIL